MPLRFPNDDDDGPVLARRRLPIDNNLDMTPMIDVTFLLLIFFLVSSVPDVQAALNLPAADHGTAVSGRQALIISVAQPSPDDERNIQIYLADGRFGEPLPADPEAQDAAIRAAVEAAARDGRRQVIIKAERRIQTQHTARLLRAASVPGVSVHVGVMERK